MAARRQCDRRHAGDEWTDRPDWRTDHRCPAGIALAARKARVARPADHHTIRCRLDSHQQRRWHVRGAPAAWSRVRARPGSGDQLDGTTPTEHTRLCRLHPPAGDSAAGFLEYRTAAHAAGRPCRRLCRTNCVGLNLYGVHSRTVSRWRRCTDGSYGQSCTRTP